MGLAAAIAALPDGRADIININDVQCSKSVPVMIARLLFGDIVALAVLGHLRARHYDVVFSHSEIVAIPFAILSHCRRQRPSIVTNAYYLVGRRNALWFKTLSIHRMIDRFLLLTHEQYEVGRDRLGIPEHQLSLVTLCGYVDSQFFRARLDDVVLDERQICSTGLEFRDYGVLIRAAAQIPEARFKIDPASPWSRHRSDVEGVDMPPNVEICRMKIGAVRRLYAASVAVAVPLRENPIGAGSTTLVEAMLSGKPVIATSRPDGTFAGRPDLIDGENIILVRTGDVEGWRAAIQRILTDRPFRTALGQKALAWAERYADRAPWIELNVQIMQAVVLERRTQQRRRSVTAPVSRVSSTRENCL